MTNIMIFYQNIFLCSLACESCSSKLGFSCPDLSRVGIRASQVKSGESRLLRDGWVLCKGFGGGGGPGACSLRKKNRNLRSSNCWKSIELVNHTITTLFLYHFKYFTTPSGGPFWPLGGALLPTYGPVYSVKK